MASARPFDPDATARAGRLQGSSTLMTITDISAHDPDQAVLVAALRDAPALPEVTDEVRLAAVASWHRLEGLLARVLAARGAGSTDLRDHFTTARAGTELRYAGLRAHLVALVRAWSEEGITATLLKGSALVEAGIVPAGERPMADLDLLVDDGDAARAHEVAGRVGFRSPTREATWDHATRRHHHLPALVHADGTTVEVHHRLLDVGHPHRGLDDLERRRERIGLDTLPALRLDDLGTWLHLAVHAWDDRRRGTGGPLLQLRDLDLLLARVDPAELVARTRSAGAAPLVGATATVLGLVAPSDVADVLRRRLGGPDPRDPRVHRFVATRILGRRSPLAQLLHPTGSVDYNPWRLATRARRQLWPPLDQVRRVHGDDAGRRRHLASMAPVVRDAMAAPLVTLRDLWLDRWAHDLARRVST